MSERVSNFAVRFMSIVGLSALGRSALESDAAGGGHAVTGGTLTPERPSASAEGKGLPLEPAQLPPEYYDRMGAGMDPLFKGIMREVDTAWSLTSEEPNADDVAALPKDLFLAWLNQHGSPESE